jgi:hypothetical protein
MRTLIAAVLGLLVLLPVVGGEGLSLDIQGECKEYNVTLFLLGFMEGCYDVKIDVTTPAGRVGEIFDPREGWKSSFFYVKGDFCIEELGITNRTYKLRIVSNSGVLNFAASARSGSRSWSTGYYPVTQDCPQGMGGEAGVTFWLGILLGMVVIVSGLVFYLYYRDN